MSDSPQITPGDGVTLDASAIGVSKIHEGPTHDALDELEASTFLERKLKCDLLRAQIESVRREDERKTLIVNRSLRRVDCIFVTTIFAILWALYYTAHPEPRLLSTLVVILAITMMDSARGANGRPR